MDNHTYGKVFEREEPRSSRPSRSTTQFRTSYNEDLMSPSIGDEGVMEMRIHPLFLVLIFCAMQGSLMISYSLLTGLD
jgi:hypothetical protein